MQVLPLVGLWALLIAAGILVGIVLPKRRSRVLQQKAAALGFRFSKLERPFVATRVETLTILEDGPDTEVENVLLRADGHMPVVIFDEYVASDTSAVATTFAAFRSVHRELPVFHIGERTILERMEEALGKKVLKMDCSADFAAHFFVQCADENQTRSFLGAAKLATLCEHAHHFYIEASPDWLLIYRPGATVSIDGVAKFVAETSVVAEALLASEPMPLPASA
jgi:hypothetical protein